MTGLCRYGSTWIRVERTREQHTLDLHMGVPWETVTLTAFGRDKSIYFKILEEGTPEGTNPSGNRFLVVLRRAGGSSRFEKGAQA